MRDVQPSVVLRVLGVSQIKDDRRMRLATTPVRKLIRELDGAVEAEAPVVEDIDPVSLEVRGGVDDGDLKSCQRPCPRPEPSGRVLTSPPCTK